MHSRFPVISTIRLSILALFLSASAALGDTMKPLLFGPFFMNQVSFWGSPSGYEYVLTNGFYHFQVGWIEPLSESKDGIFSETYFETNGNLNAAPFTSDLGTTFNLKPIRYLELGLSYNRLLFHNSMVSFPKGESTERHPPKDQYTPEQILASDNKEVGGADIFIYQANLTFDLWRSQFYVFVSRQYWDIDAKGREFVYEYRNDMLIRTRDRVNHVNAVVSLDLRPWSFFPKVSFHGLEIRDRFWDIDHTGLRKNLVSAGITGFRFGRNPKTQQRGLDVSVGYWTSHDQIPKGDVAKSILLIADWKWNIHFFKM